MPKWDVGKRALGARAGPRSTEPDYIGHPIGTVNADTLGAAITQAVRDFAHVGLNASNIAVRPHKPEP